MRSITAYAFVLIGMFVWNVIVTGGGDFQSLAVSLLWFGYGAWVNYYISEVMR
jgi:Flp pilus assembly protein protease CpaA